MQHSDESLRRDVLDLMARGFDAHTDDAAFDALALRAFRRQYERVAPYRAYCDRRGRTPDRVDSWMMIPAVPTAAFKEVALVTGAAADAQAVFRTSGTTRGVERRGAHYVLDLSLYHASLLPTFAACVLPDGARPRMLSLVPAAADAPDSSLSHMIDVVMKQLGAPDSATFADAQHGIDYDRLATALHEAQRADRAVCLLGTSFAFVHWIDHLDAHDVRFTLPAGSRLMDTGGYKGRSREVGEEQLRAQYARVLGVAADHCINEYGMTEMCSQFYDASLRAALRGRTDTVRTKIGPPWVRTRVVHPETLEPLPHGETGILRHVDLANLDSVAAIQTEDLGVADGDGFRLLGRAPGAMPRGCSIAMDMLLEAARESRAP
jgi:hypothetical protein